MSPSGSKLGEPNKAVKQLFIFKKPPPILSSRLRSQDKTHHAKLSTMEAEEDPRTFGEAMQRPDKNQWLRAMQEEIDSLKKNKVWQLLDRPNGNVVTNKW